MSDTNANKGFGTFTGVIVPNVTMMFGVILFLRLGVVVGNVGLWEFIGIISLSLAFMVITSLSIATIVTNMQVGGGGAYYLISRSLGIEIGGAIGIALVLSQLISLSLVVAGFAYSLAALFPDLSIIGIEVVTMFALGLLSFTSADLALKTQTLVFFILFIAVGATFFSDSTYTAEVGEPLFNPPLSFWGGFAIFYPALTGIEAGMALSGNLRSPSRSLSIGNTFSLVLVAAVYMLMAVYLYYSFPAFILRSDPLVLISQAYYSPIIYLGIWCATLSSALGNFLGAPRMLQMIAEDGIAPDIFSRTYGKHDEPRWAIGAIFVTAILIILFTTMDQIIPILTMICLLTYGTLNLVAGIAELIHSPNWRPSFHCPWQVSLTGAFLSLLIMLMIDPGWTFASISVVSVIYIVLRNKGLDVSFQDFRDSILMFFTRRLLYRLNESSEHATNWLPQLAVFSRAPTQHERMVRISNTITRRHGILTLASIVPEIWGDPEQIDRTKQVIRDQLKDIEIEGLIEVQSYPSFYEGIANMIKSYGIGPLQPNSLVMPISENAIDEVEEIADTLEIAQLNYKNTLLFFDNPDLPMTKYAERSVKRKVVDLWWDQDNRQSFELILSYTMAMRTSPVWGNRIVNIRAVTPDHSAREHLEEYFRELLKRMRVRAKMHVSIVEEGITPLEAVGKYSKSADLVYFPVRPAESFEKKEDLVGYLIELLQKLHIGVPIMAVTSYDRTDHREIFRD